MRERLKSFRHAINGLKILLVEEHNARIHFIVAFFVLIAGLFLKISLFEWIVVILSIGFVISLEIINTSIENIADFVSPDKHEKIKKIKDLSAASVLVGAITSFIIGLIIFIPKLLRFYSEF